MSADDDTELRDLVIDSLEKKGVLGKIKAELRATVFLALEENEKDSIGGSTHGDNQSQQELHQFLETEQGLIVLSLVKDFLEQFQLNFSIAVLEPEVSSPKKCIPRNELGSLLKLTPGCDIHCPLLSLLLNNKSPPILSNDVDLNSNPAQHLKNSPIQNVLFEKNSFSSNLFNIHSKVEKEINENQSKHQPPLLGEDTFFDEQLPASKSNSLFYNYLDKPVLSKPNSDSGKNGLSSLLESKGSEGKVESRTTIKDEAKGGFGLSSLRNLPSLVNEPAKPKEGGRKQWRETEPEQKERIMNLTFGNKQDLEDDFLSPTSSGSDRKEKDLDGNPVEPDASIEEDIEEDLSALADSASSKDENFTTDKSVSGFSKAGGFDYMENLT